MARMPSGPWYTAYIPAITASSTCAVQMLEVAFSRRMCCSRVCSAMRSAGFPSESVETPMMRPGICRFSSSRQAKKAACGPPKPSGTPKRCVVPTTMSAPHSPGGVSRASERRSAATMTAAPSPRARCAKAPWSITAPSVAGYCRRKPKTGALKSNASTSPTTTSMSRAAARVFTTSMVCGWQWSETKKVLRSAPPAIPYAIAMASAAAVPSSRSEALATGRPVRSTTIVWKLRSASRRPCAISAW